MAERTVEPICSHFGACGGCSLQHLPHADYLAHKRGIVVNAFAEAGVEAQIEDIISCPIHSRRRVTFTARRNGKAITVGYQKRRSHDLVAVQDCPIALPAIVNTLPTLRDLASTLLQGLAEAQFAITACGNGLDLNVMVDAPPAETITADFVRLLARSSFIRCSIAGEIVFERDKPVIGFDGVSVVVPPGGFLQAVESAEEVMAALVTGHLKKARRVADLFAGCGTFALRLAKRARVHAVEAYQPALDNLKSASGGDGLKPVTVEIRDLFDLPLTASELKPYDGLCLDPPRAGAAAQVREIAKTDIPRVGYVSCNPETLAGDAKALVRDGYRLDRVVPVDQFVFSNHVEAVALFSKQAPKAKRSIFR